MSIELTEDDNKEVLNFLQELKKDQEPKKETDIVNREAELTEDEFDFMQNSKALEAQERIKDVPEIAARDEFQRKPYQDLFAALIADIGLVEVSDFEKDIFIKSILNDSPFVTTSLILNGKLSVAVKSRTMYTDKLIFQALGRDETLGNVIGIESMMFKLQMYVAATQVVSYGNKSVNLDIDPSKTFDENYAILNNHIESTLGAISTHVWAGIVMGVRIHEYKSKICMDNLNNENFWESAGIN